ncbi:MAG: hypothetical protein ACD_47C00003G0002 [uncultured bacterium]|nr:MAG: hypothetical protein ACD_47C00003G0002 [uncultured bacterium]
MAMFFSIDLVARAATASETTPITSILRMFEEFL